MGDTIAFCPPLIISEAEIDELLARFASGFEAALAEARQSALLPT
jgi:4-aminobutyrate--pyruvate transaminase